MKIKKEYNNYYIVTYKKLWKEKTIQAIIKANKIYNERIKQIQYST